MPPRRRQQTLRIELFKGESRRYRSVLHRADGVDVELEGGSYNRVGGTEWEVPHDLAHLVVESELGLEMGVWGVLADGGLFRLARVVCGRQAPHAAKRGREIVREAGDRLNQAEILTGAICDAVCSDHPKAATVKSAVGERWWTPAITDVSLARARHRLREGGRRWAMLNAGEAIPLEWPSRPEHGKKGAEPL